MTFAKILKMAEKEAELIFKKTGEILMSNEVFAIAQELTTL